MLKRTKILLMTATVLGFGVSDAKGHYPRCSNHQCGCLINPATSKKKYITCEAHKNKEEPCSNGRKSTNKPDHLPCGLPPELPLGAVTKCEAYCSSVGGLTLEKYDQLIDKDHSTDVDTHPHHAHEHHAHEHAHEHHVHEDTK